MSRSYPSLTFTPEVLDAQTRYGSRAVLQRLRSDGSRPDVADRTAAAEGDPGTARDPLTEAERAFLARLDGFYIATVSSAGWPYVQFRGGPPGFIRTPDQHTIAWDDYRGNRQYISVGNLATTPRVALIFMDYALQLRLKVVGSAHITDAEPRSVVARRPAPASHEAKVERAVTIDVVAFDWNCPRHITPRYTQQQVETAATPLRQRIRELEAEKAARIGSGHPPVASSQGE